MKRIFDPLTAHNGVIVKKLVQKKARKAGFFLEQGFVRSPALQNDDRYRQRRLGRRWERYRYVRQ
jgi:hypothetical protein